MSIRLLTATLFAIATLLSPQQVSAVPATPYPIKYQLPDGSEITMQLRGDEYVHWRVSLDGYTMLFNSEGFLEYAVQNPDGDLQLSGIRAHNKPERTAEETNYLSKIPKALTYSAAQIDAIRQVRNIATQAQQAQQRQIKQTKVQKQIQIEGTIRIPIILIQFKDKKFVKTKEDFQVLLDQENYSISGITGSLRDYYKANSYGKMDLRVDVFGPYTLPENLPVYNSDCKGGDSRVMARLAVDSAYYRGGADFSNYTINNSDSVSTIHIIYAGHGAESSGSPDCQQIWAHADWLPTPVIHNGKTIYKYSCSAELAGATGSGISHIGVIAHELGHSLCNLLDYYDVDYASNGTAIHLNGWCLMAGGSWNNQGKTPSYFSAHARIFCGWVQEITLSKPTDINLPYPNNPNNAKKIYRINTTTANEYFLLENRQKTEWDAYVPSSGMLIYHVNENNFGWTNNNINSVANSRGYYVEQAGCAEPNGCACEAASGNPSDYGCETDPFPQDNKTEFTDNSTPNSKSWAGANTNKPVTEIKYNAEQGSISFKFMGGIPITYNDAALTEIIAEHVMSEEGTQEIKVKFENFGKSIKSADIIWKVNGLAQSPIQWTGNLASESSTVVTLGLINFTAGSHIITATVTVNNDSLPLNNTIKKVIKVTTPIITEDFEGDVSNITLANGTQTNKWHTGTATAAANSSKSAYISNNGIDNQYTILNGISISHLYYDITFPSSTDSFDLYFDFKGIGEISNNVLRDYVEIRVVETSITPTDSLRLTEGISLGKYNNCNTWQTMHCVLPAEYSGTTKRLVFSWINDRTGGNQPPAAIDNITIALRPELPELYGIALSQNGTLVLDTAAYNYEEYSPISIAINNSGTKATGKLTITLGGTDASSFTLSTSAIPDIAVDTYGIFSIAPKAGLEPAAYTASITVSGDNELSESFDISFTVKNDSVEPGDTNSTATLELENKLRVYPNPVVNGSLIVEIPQNVKKETIRIYDFSGKVVLTHIAESPKTEINISGLPNAVYVIKAGNFSAKIIKQ
jgi:M6 family metalloprotease-like protein